MSTELPEYAECAWPVDPACFEDAWDDMDDEVKDRALSLASSTLRRLTGYRVGGCPVTVRPCKPGCAGRTLPYYGGPAWGPSMTAEGAWINSCGCQTSCSCTALCSIDLPAPVGRVDEVKVDGDVLDTTDYRLLGSSLVWAGDGDCPWPTCQDLTLDDDEEGTFSVTYLNAYPVDRTGAYAVGVLAMEYAKACSGGKCRLPPNVISIARQGVTYQLEGGAFPSGMVGIREVDSFIAMWNPRGLTSEARVWVPGMDRSPVVR